MTAKERRELKAQRHFDSFTHLKRIMKEGMELQCMQVGHNSSGTRFYQVFIMTEYNGKPSLDKISFSAANVLDRRVSESKMDAIIMPGGGYSAAQEIAESLSYALFGSPDKLSYREFHVV